MGAVEALGGLRQNVLGGTLYVGEHVRIPKPDNPPTLTLKIICAPLTGGRLLDMLAAVEPDAKPSLTARKIDDEGWHSQLPVKAGR